MKKTVIVIITALLAVLPSAGQDLQEHREQKKQLEEEIAMIDKQLEATGKKRQKGLNTLILTRQKLQAREKLIKQLDAEISGYDRSISSAGMQIKRLNDRLDTLRKYHADLVLGAYKTRDNKVWLMYILSSKDINQGLRRWSYLKNISRSIREQAEAIRNTELELQQESARLEQLKAGSMQTRNEREKERQSLSSEEREANSLVVKLSRQEKAMQRELRQKQKEVERLNKEIERILAEAVQQQKDGTGEKVDYALSAKFGDNKGRLPWPVKGVVIQKFGQNYHPVFKNLKMPYNNGINISAAAGSTACAVFDGVVKQILVMPGYDQCVLVQHGEYFTFYCKLKRVYVKAGDRVSTGGRIGDISLNEDGNAELHFQLWKGTAKQNPENWLR
ncbi:MAG TPA: peptidoglycan DD-metalloendopeptidase family protein [Candidatus Coprenecus merdigallinarum]|nr:peptidoglycan DD-metalloendopeptidase family protein [Candidatus Coprenecus merdigallinarum]